MKNNKGHSDNVSPINGEDLEASIAAREAREASERNAQPQAAEEVAVTPPSPKKPWYKHWATKAAGEGVVIGTITGMIVFAAVKMASKK